MLDTKRQFLFLWKGRDKVIFCAFNIRKRLFLEGKKEKDK